MTTAQIILTVCAVFAGNVVVAMLLKPWLHEADEQSREREAERFGVFYDPDNFETFIHGSAVDAAPQQ